jgi:hypothetical protein
MTKIFLIPISSHADHEFSAHSKPHSPRKDKDYLRPERKEKGRRLKEVWPHGSRLPTERKRVEKVFSKNLCIFRANRMCAFSLIKYDEPKRDVKFLSVCKMILQKRGKSSS